MLRRTNALGVCLAIGICLLMIGCESLYQPLPRRIAATRLSCEAYPRLVDGNLATTAILKVKKFVEKDYTIHSSSSVKGKQYGDWLEGKFKAEASIQLDTLTPIAYINVHPVSNIYRLSVDIATTEIQPGKQHLFEPVRSHKIARSENGAVYSSSRNPKT